MYFFVINYRMADAAPARGGFRGGFGGEAGRGEGRGEGRGRGMLLN